MNTNIKIRTLFFVVSLLLMSASIAKPVEPQRIQVQAQHFWFKHCHDGRKSTPLVAHSDERWKNLSFFTPAEGDGFVLLATDNAVSPILAYSFDGTILDAKGNLVKGNVAFEQWAESYNREISRLSSLGVSNTDWDIATNLHKEKDDLGNTITEDEASYLLSTNWGQGNNTDPSYNAQCPYDSAQNKYTIAGCGATAMSQVMRYWGWPLMGAGEEEYDDTIYGKQHVVFGNTHYLWDSMPNTLTAGSSAGEKEATATLTYHCAVALRTQFGVRGSSSNPTAIANALTEYFGYKSDNGIAFAKRSNCDDDADWIAILKNEIDARRPIIYFGFNEASAGHGFVCDGYDNDDKFHFNWGWNGSYNGFYAIGSLNPAGGGAGSNSTNSFNENNMALVYIEPDSSISTYPSAPFELSRWGDTLKLWVRSATTGTNTPLSLSLNGAWDGLTVSPSQSQGEGEVTLFTFVSPENTSGNSRFCPFTITQGGITNTANTFQRDATPSPNQCYVTHVDTSQLEWAMEAGSEIILRPETFGSFTDTQQVSQISFVIKDIDMSEYNLGRFEGRNFTIKIYEETADDAMFGQGKSFSATDSIATTVYSQAYHATDAGLQSVDLTTPYIIHDGFFWISIYCNENSGFAAGVTDSIAITENEFPKLSTSSGNIRQLFAFPKTGNKIRLESQVFCDSLFTVQYERQAAIDFCIAPIAEDEPEDSCQTITAYDTATLIDSFDWHGYTYTVAGTYADTVVNAIDGICDSIYVLQLISDTSSSDSCQTITAYDTATLIDSFDWRGNTYTAAGTYADTVANAVDGMCDSIYVLQLISDTDTISSDSCQNLTAYDTATLIDSFDWRGNTYTTTGTYADTVQNAVDGICDSIYVLQLISDTDTISSDSCQNITAYDTATLIDSFDWRGNTYTAAGTYADTVQNAIDGICDSIYVLQLISDTSTTPSDTTFTDSCQTIITCDTAILIDSFAWRNNTFSTTGTYSDTLFNAAGEGCDSIFLLELIVDTTAPDTCASIIVSESIMSRTAISWRGDSIFATGNYYDTVVNAVEGMCDSIYHLAFTLSDTIILQLSLTECDSVDWHGQHIFASGNYTDTLFFEDSIRIDTIYLLNLTIAHGTPRVQNQEDCVHDGWSFTFYDTTITASGTYFHAAIDSVNQCPTVDTLHITLHETHQFDSLLVVEDSLPFTWRGTTYRQSDTISDTVTWGSFGSCDSIYTLHLTLNYTDTTDTPTDTTITPNDSTFLVSAEAVPAEAGRVTGGNTSIERGNSVTLTASRAAGSDWKFAHWSNGERTNPLTLTPTCDTTVNALFCRDITVYDTLVGYLKVVWREREYPRNGDFTFTVDTSILSKCDSIFQLHIVISDQDTFPVIDTVTPIDTTTPEPPAPTLFTVTTTASPLNGGTISGGGQYTADSVAILIATPNEGFRFAGWSNGASSDTILVAVTGDTTLSALFCHDTTLVSNIVTCSTYPWRGNVYQGDTTVFDTVPQAINGTCDSFYVLHLQLSDEYRDTLNQLSCGPFSWYDSTYTITGTYSHHIETGGCDSLRTLRLVVDDGTHITDSLSICDQYLWHDSIYSLSGIHTYLYANSNGCASVDTLVLNILHSEHHLLNETACEQFLWHDSAYTHSGIHTYSYLSNEGCASSDTLSLSLNNSTHLISSETACTPYLWHDTLRAETGNYIYHYTNAAGCASSDTLFLTVAERDHRVIERTECDTFTWNLTGLTYRQSGTYIFEGISPNGCPSLDTLVLTILHSAERTTEQHACDQYSWRGNTYTTSGDYYDTTNRSESCPERTHLILHIHHGAERRIDTTVCDHLFWRGNTFSSNTSTHITYADSNGCTATDTLNLTIIPNAYGSDEAHACGRLTFNGIHYFHSTTVYDTSGAANGCDSIVTLTLNVIPNDTVWSSARCCDSYTWRNQTCTETDNYYENIHGVTPNACDSVFALRLTVFRSANVIDEHHVCYSYNWHDSTYTASTQTPRYQTTTTAGCDSVVTLHLTVNSTIRVIVNDTACDSMIWHGTTYSASTTTEERGISHAQGCDSITVLNLIINYSDILLEERTACDTFRWAANNHLYTSDTTQTLFSGLNSEGCPHARQLVLTVAHNRQWIDTVSVCNDYTWRDGHTYTNDTTGPIHTTTDANGCLNTAMLHLTIDSIVNVPVFEESCEYFNWIDGHTYRESTNSPTRLKFSSNFDGCDTLFNLRLTVHHAIQTSENRYGCDSLRFQDSTYLENGQKVLHALSAFGCDSSHTINLIIRHADHIEMAPVTDCDIHYTPDSVYRTSTTLETFRGANLAGCDSVVFTPIIIHYHSRATDFAEECGSYLWNGYLFEQSMDTTFVLGSNRWGCDSIVDIRVIIHPTHHTDSARAYCQSYLWHDSLYLASTTAHYVGTNRWGCDSIIDLRLTIYPNDTLEVPINHCDFYTWHGTMFRMDTVALFVDSTYPLNHPGHGYCPDVERLTLHLRYADTTRMDSTVCDELGWHAMRFRESGIAAWTGTNIANCDSVVILNLTVKYSTDTFLIATACDRYRWHDSTYTRSTNEAVYYRENMVGCDSAIHLNLNVYHSDTVDTTIYACNHYYWNNRNYTHSVTDTFHSPANIDCNGMEILHLHIGYNQQTSERQTVCDSLHWGDSTYRASTIARYTSQTAFGCDSVATLHLTVLRSSHSAVYVDECERYSWHGVTYTASTDSATFRRSNSIGCDSIITLHLTIHNRGMYYDTILACHSYDYRGRTYTASGIIDRTQAVSSHGCDSNTTVVLAIGSGSDTAIDRHEACNSFRWRNGTTYRTSTQTPTLTLTDRYGCDSIVTLHLTLHTNTDAYDSAAACDSFQWHGVTYRQSSDTIMRHLSGAFGCDSNIHLRLYIGRSLRQISDTAVCDSLLWHNLVLRSDTTATVRLNRSSVRPVIYGTPIQCDSFAYIRLHILTNRTESTVRACESVVWDGRTYVSSTNLEERQTNRFGCDSLNLLHLIVDHTEHISNEVQSCKPYTWRNGITYYASTFVVDTAHNVHSDLGSCDTLYYLNLQLDTAILVHLDTIANENLVWGGETYRADGDYTHTFVNANGCDSIVTIHLTLVHLPAPQIIKYSKSMLLLNHYPNGEQGQRADYYAYQWYKNSEPLTGETTDILRSASNTTLKGCYYVMALADSVNNIWLESNHICIDWTGIDAPDASNAISLFPNPAPLHTPVQVQSTQILSFPATLTLYDMHGVKLQQQPFLQQATILPPATGSYIVSITSAGNTIATLKLVVR